MIGLGFFEIWWLLSLQWEKMRKVESCLEEKTDWKPVHYCSNFKKFVLVNELSSPRALLLP